MDLKYFYDCKSHLLACLLAVLVCASCSSSKEATPQVPVDDLPQILREARAQPDTTRNDPSDDVKLRFKNKGTSVTIPIDPQSQDFILELKGLDKGDLPWSEQDAPQKAAMANQMDKQEQDNRVREQRRDSTILQDSLVQAKMAENVKQVLKDFRKAQDLFYRKDYRGALEMVNRSLETQRTADALGLKGTIFFMRDDISSAKYYWNKAVMMDPDIPLPNVPELESFIQEIKATEDQEEAQQ